MRPAYVPIMQEHRIELLNGRGQLIPKPNSSSRPITIAGPLCHSTDYLAKGRTDLAEPRVGDFVLLLDCGTNTLSTFSKHCSRQTPPVFAFSRRQNDICVVEIKAEESELAALDFWS